MEYITAQIAGRLTKGKAGLPSAWRPVWIISVCIVVTEAVFYLFFASGEVQPWNSAPEQPELEKEKKKKDVEM